jgi:hypothetical protein
MPELLRKLTHMQRNNTTTTFKKIAKLRESAF